MVATSHRLLAGLVAPVVVLCAACGGGAGSGALKDAGQTGAAAEVSSAAAALASALAAGKGSAATSAAGAATTAGPSVGAAAGTVAAASANPVSLRFANLFVTSQKEPGPGLDIYDTPMGQAAKPLIAGLAYGAVSAYVHPVASNGISQFYAVPAGEDPVAKQADAKGLGGLQDDGSHPQETIRLTGQPGTIEQGALAGLGFSTIVEKGTDNGYKAPVAPPPPAGQGELLVDTAAFSTTTPSTGNFLLIDDSCAPPLNGDPNVKGLPEIFAADGQPPVSSFAEFATTAGAHQVSVDIETSGTDLTCAKLATKQSTSSVTVAAGQQVLVFLYGTSATDAHLAYAPVAP